MSTSHGLAVVAAFAAALPLFISVSAGQTPEQQKTWEADRARTAAAQRAAAEQLERDRAARKADPMRWVRTLDPMSSGGWEFRTVAPDGSSAIFSSTHQLSRSGHVITVWLRQEFAESQRGEEGPYFSTVEKRQYDCKKQLTRPLLVMYYAGNNIQGTSATDEADPKTASWNAIVPGTREETSYLWACGTGK